MTVYPDPYAHMQQEECVTGKLARLELQKLDTPARSSDFAKMIEVLQILFDKYLQPLGW